MERTYLKAAKVAKEIGVPFELLTLTMDRYKKQDNLQENTDYILSDGDVYFTLSGLLWAVARCDGDFRGAVALAEKLATNEESEKVVEEHNKLLKSLPELKEALLLAQETIDTALESATPIIPESKSRMYYRKNSKHLPDLTTEESEWSKKMNHLLTKKAKTLGKMGVHIQKRIYTQMTRRYGIVWDVVKKETLRRFNVDTTESITTFRCVVYDKTLRSIYEALLTDFDGQN